MNNENKSTKFYSREYILTMPFLISVSLALMYVICRSQIVICTVIMSALTCGVYFLFYSVRKKRGYCALSFLAVGVVCAAALAMVLSDMPDSEFMDFVFTASKFFDPLYAAVSIIVFSAVIGFVTCYFSAYSPRPCFIMLPSFIPLILSSRTAGGLPEPMLIFMLASYAAAVAVMRRYENTGDPCIDDKHSSRERVFAVSLAAVVVAGLLAVIPRSSATPQGEFLDNVFTDGNGYLQRSSQLTNFMISSSVNRGGNEPEGNLLFTVQAKEPVNIIRWSFDTYHGADGWRTAKEFDGGYRGWENAAANRCAAITVYKLKNAAENGALSDYEDILDDIPYSVAGGVRIENEAFSPTTGVKIQVMDGSSTRVILHPHSTTYVYPPLPRDKIYRTQRDEIFCNTDLRENASYSVEYSADRPNEEFIKAVEKLDYKRLLKAARDEDILNDAEVKAILDEREFAEDYRRVTYSEGMSDELVELADEITSGLDSDYDKALAIERWFGEAGFIYDMDYVPARADADYFIFKSKRGICSDFASAATLLLRAAGLTARYTEGFALSKDIMGDDGLYYVTDAEAHAFSMVYLDGYGWMEIDGTKYASVAEEKEVIPKWLLVGALALAGAAAILIIIFRKQLSELIFSLTWRFRKPSARVRAIFLRTRALACAISGDDPAGVPAGEVRGVISRALGMKRQADEICGAADELFYGGGGVPADTKRLYLNYRDIRRMKRRLKK